jgi:hypothetical protein
MDQLWGHQHQQPGHVFLRPDGKVTNGGSATGPGKSLNFVIKYNGKIGTRGVIEPGADGNGTYTDCNCDPPWFGWNK